MRFPDNLCGKLVAWRRQEARRMTLEREAVKKERSLECLLMTMNSESQDCMPGEELY